MITGSVTIEIYIRKMNNKRFLKIKSNKNCTCSLRNMNFVHT